MQRFGFFPLLLPRVFEFHTRRGKQVCIDPSEVAFQMMPFDELLDSVDRLVLAFLEEFGQLLAAHLDQDGRAIVADRCEVRRGAAGHSAGDRAPIDDDNTESGLAEF